MSPSKRKSASRYESHSISLFPSLSTMTTTQIRRGLPQLSWIILLDLILHLSEHSINSIFLSKIFFLFLLTDSAHLFSVVSLPVAFIKETSRADLGALALDEAPRPTLTASQSWPVG